MAAQWSGRSLAACCCAGLLLLMVYLAGDHRYAQGRWLGMVSITYSTDWALNVGCFVWALSVPCGLCRILAAPRPQRSSFSTAALYPRVCGWLFARFIKAAVWLLWLTLYIGCHFLGMLYSYWSTVPVSGWKSFLLTYLPGLDALATMLFPPILARKLCTCVNTSLPAQRLLGQHHGGHSVFITPRSLLAGTVLVSWAAPVAVVVWTSQNCRGTWWAYYDKCTAKLFDYCDLPIYTENYVFNRTTNKTSLKFTKVNSLMDIYGGCAITTGEVCNARWLRPDRCTMTVMDMVIPLLFSKAISAAILTMAYLLLCKLARRCARDVSQAGAAADGSMRCHRCSAAWRLLRFHGRPRAGIELHTCPVAALALGIGGFGIGAMFNLWESSAVELLIASMVAGVVLGTLIARFKPYVYVDLQTFVEDEFLISNMTTYSDIGLAWGLMSPMVAFATFTVIEVQRRVREIARVEFESSRREDAQYKISQTILLIGLVSSHLLWVCHLLSAGRIGVLMVASGFGVSFGLCFMYCMTMLPRWRHMGTPMTTNE